MLARIYDNLSKFKAVADSQIGHNDIKIMQNYYELLSWLRSNEKHPELIDVNDSNFGYDKHGNLKMLDI